MAEVDPRKDLLERFAPEHSSLVRLAHRIGPDAMECVLAELGGGKAYLPHPATFWRSLERELRDARIRAEFTGDNYRELAELHGISVRWIREIVHR